MGDASTPLSAIEARHLLSRAGFGALPRDLSKLTGMPRGEAVYRILKFKPAKFKPGGRDLTGVQNNWIKYMIRSKSPLQEKLVLFWHDHFATGDSTVGNYRLMAMQNRRLRAYCKGNFKDFVKLINKDAAMMEFLDTVRNSKAQPNENYSRELQELFTLGVEDFNGNPNYSEEDVAQIARAFTGWRYDDDRDRTAFLRTSRHDFSSEFPERGPKVIYKTVGGFGPAGRSFTVNGEGEAEIDTVVDIIFEHRDSDGRNTVARHITRKLIEYFAHPAPAVSFVDGVIATSGFDSNWDLQALLQAIFVDDSFYLSAAMPGGGTKKSFKWPIDYVVSTLRLLKVVPKGRDLEIARSGRYVRLRTHLANMGQVLMDPPSVFGWDWEEAWASSQTMLNRYAFARDVTGARDGGSSSFRPEKLMDMTLTNPGDIVDAVTGILGVRGQLSPSARQALVNYLGPGPIDLLDFQVRNIKLHGLFALVLQSPHYQLH
jgi:uncharacterized protein (DUF1800 family)